MLYWNKGLCKVESSMGPIVVKPASKGFLTSSDFSPGISQREKEWEKCEVFKKKKMEHEIMFWVRWHPIDKIYTKRIGAGRVFTLLEEGWPHLQHY